MKRILLILTLLPACTSDANTKPTFANVAGSFSGPFSGTSQGASVSGSITFTITQTDGLLMGAYGATGAWDFGHGGVGLTGTGTLTGTVTSGDNPSVTLDVHDAGCPNLVRSYTGMYDTAIHRLTLTGQFFHIAPPCSVDNTFQLNLVMNR